MPVDPPRPTIPTHFSQATFASRLHTHPEIALMDIYWKDNKWFSGHPLNLNPCHASMFKLLGPPPTALDHHTTGNIHVQSLMPARPASHTAYQSQLTMTDKTTPTLDIWCLGNKWVLGGPGGSSLPSNFPPPPSPEGYVGPLFASICSLGFLKYGARMRTDAQGCVYGTNMNTDSCSPLQGLSSGASG